MTGTGTSQGVPVIGCTCPVCLSDDPRDVRLRSAAFISSEGTHVAIDAGPDFRQQMLLHQVRYLDGLLITHEHNDHVAGLDDIRPFNFIQKQPLLVFALDRVCKDIRQRFAYIFSEISYPGAPEIELIKITPYQQLQIGKLRLIPFLVQHGPIDVLAFRSGPFVYITDANHIPKRSKLVIQGAKVMVINALHHKAHHSHFNLEQAILQAKELGIERVFFTHISHQMGLYEEVSRSLPPGVSLACDNFIMNF